MRTLTRIALLSVVGAAASTADAAGMNFFRCKDASGKTHYSTAMPVECQGRDTEVLNDRGTVINVIEGEQSRAKTLEREAEEANRLKERNDQLQRDRVLLETYLAVSDIERLRDQRLDLLEAQLKVAEQHIATLHGRLDQLRQQTARFKPYSSAPNAPPLPDHLAEALVGTLKSIDVDKETMRLKKEEQATLTANFARDIERFKQLKSLK